MATRSRCSWRRPACRTASCRSTSAPARSSSRPSSPSRPNNRMPAIVDSEPQGGGAPLSVFESGAILLYLAEKSGRLLPAELHARFEVIQWLFWQMAGLGPMAGQNHHFARYAPEKLPYAITRYVNETNRLYGVLNTRLARAPLRRRRRLLHRRHRQLPVDSARTRPRARSSTDFPHLQRWFEAIRARPATERAYEKGKAISTADHPHRRGQEDPVRPDRALRSRVHRQPSIRTAALALLLAAAAALASRAARRRHDRGCSGRCPGARGIHTRCLSRPRQRGARLGAALRADRPGLLRALPGKPPRPAHHAPRPATGCRVAPPTPIPTPTSACGWGAK